MPAFDARFRTLGDAPEGDALKAQRAVTPEGAEAIVKTVEATDPPSFEAGVLEQPGSTVTIAVSSGPPAPAPSASP
ncbi:MAG: hypothetical protein ACM3MJ_02470 [Deltaproteobacteria bacterium]